MRQYQPLHTPQDLESLRLVEQFFEVANQAPHQKTLSSSELKLAEKGIVQEAARISINLRNNGQLHTVSVETVQDFINGTKLAVHQLNEEAAGELSRDLIPILECPSFFRLQDQLLELSVVAAKVLQGHVEQNGGSSESYAKYRTSVNALCDKLESRVRDFNRDYLDYFKNGEVVDPAARVTATAVYVSGRAVDRPSDLPDTPFKLACDFLANEFITNRPSALIVLSSVFNSVVKALQADSSCKLAHSNRNYFVERFFGASGEQFSYNYRYYDRSIKRTIDCMCEVFRDENFLDRAFEVTRINEAIKMMFRWEAEYLIVPELHSMLDNFEASIP